MADAVLLSILLYDGKNRRGELSIAFGAPALARGQSLFYSQLALAACPKRTAPTKGHWVAQGAHIYTQVQAGLGVRGSTPFEEVRIDINLALSPCLF